MTARPAVGHIIYFIRHGETDWNTQGRLQGQRDVPLNRMGRRQAEEAGAVLRTLVDDLGALEFVASPLARTRETMERLRDTLGLNPSDYRLDPRLKEISFGRWEGSTWKEIRRRDPVAWMLRNGNRWGFVPPGGESYADLAIRIAPFLADTTRDTVIVSHGGVARAMLARIAGLPTHEATDIPIWQGKVLVVGRDAFRWVPADDHCA